MLKEKGELLYEALVLLMVLFIFSGGLQSVSSKAYLHYQERVCN